MCQTCRRVLRAHLPTQQRAKSVPTSQFYVPNAWQSYNLACQRANFQLAKKAWKFFNYFSKELYLFICLIYFKCFVYFKLYLILNFYINIYLLPNFICHFFHHKSWSKSIDHVNWLRNYFTEAAVRRCFSK